MVVFAPRRYGKTSLVERVAQRLVTRRVLVGQINLMRTPTKERLAGKLAAVVHEDFAGPLGRARDRGARLFRGLRIAPTMTVDATDGSLGFSFGAGHAPEDVDATLERLFEMVAELATERGRRGVLVLDEFQEVMDVDPGLPKLMRSVFQDQPEVAHVYLGSRRHMMERIFNDENEPFWRSAKKTEIGVIPPEEFAPFVAERFEATGRSAPPATVSALLAITHGHPYATQELCYFLWEETPRRSAATTGRLETALERVLRSEHAHFSIVWERASSAQKLLLQALAEQSGHPLSEAYRTRHGLRSASSVQKALDALEREELVGRDRGRAWIAEPFLPEWIRRNAR